MAVPSVGRGSPSPVRPAMAGCLGDIWTCREAVQHRTRGDIYTSSPVRRGPAVDGGDGASIDLSIHTYIHTYIYIYTQVLVDAPGHEIYCSETAVHPPAAGPRATRPDVPLSRRGAPLGVDAGPGGPFWPTANWSIPRLAPLHGDRPRERSARPWPTANWRERVSPATVARARARPQSSQSPSANWPTPRTPSIPSIRPHAHGPRLPALASSTAALVPPGSVRGCGGRVQRSPSSSVAVELRPPPRGPVTLPHAGRLIASLIDSPALVGPPSCAQTLPCPEMIPGGRVVHQRWATWSGASISGCQLAGSLRVCRGRAGPRVRHGGVPNLGLGVPNLGLGVPNLGVAPP